MEREHRQAPAKNREATPLRGSLVNSVGKGASGLRILDTPENPTQLLESLEG